ncbi:MAG: sulfatase-like hydrolase/transferase [Verrucomicrobiota bacterium]
MKPPVFSALLSTALLLVVCSRLPAETLFYADFEYASGSPTVGTNAANIGNGMSGLVGSFSGSLPTAATSGGGQGQFQPELIGFVEGSGDTSLFLDRPDENQPNATGSFSANLSSVRNLDGLVVSFDLATRRGTNSGDGSYRIVGYDSSGNESFHLFVSADKLNNPGSRNRMGVVYDGGTGPEYDLVTEFGGTGTPLDDDLFQTANVGSQAGIQLTLGASSYALDFDGAFNSNNQFTASSIPYNGTASQLARIEFSFEASTGYQLDNILVTNTNPGPLPTPDSPINLTVQATDGQVVLDWADDTSGALDFYSVYRSESSPVTTFASVVGSPSDSSFTDTGVTNGTTYYYAVLATATDGNSSVLSEEVAATPMIAAPPTSELFLSGFSINPSSGDGEVTIHGSANKIYKLVNSDNLDFESPDEDPVPFTGASRGVLGEYLDKISTDGQGEATVQFNVGSKDATFFRAETSVPSKPNIIIFFSDDQDKEHLGAYGDQNADTPHIDSLATDGLLFNSFYVGSAVCSPSRYSLLSGRHASRSLKYQDDVPAGTHNNVQWQPGLDGDPVMHSLPGVLQANGYMTGMVGKWHNTPKSILPHAIGNGSDEIDNRAEPTDLDWFTDTVPKLEANYAAIVNRIKEQGFDFADGVFISNVLGDWLPRYLEVHCQEFITKAGLDFIDQSVAAEKPFFLYMAATVPHSPNPGVSLQNDDFRTPIGVLPELEGVQPSRQSVLDRVSNSSDRGSTWFDDGVGAILDKLDQLNIAENTLILYISDHGSQPSKMTSYDGGARVPGIARWPAVIEPGRVSDALATNYDVPALVYDILDLQIDPAVTVDGVSFLAELMGEEYVREHIFLEIASERAVVTDDGFKYMAIRFPPDIQADIDANGTLYGHDATLVPFDENRDVRYNASSNYPRYFDQNQLYDLNNDPRERTNLYDDPDYADKQAELRAILTEYCQGLEHIFGEFKTAEDFQQ